MHGLALAGGNKRMLSSAADMQHQHLRCTHHGFYSICVAATVLSCSSNKVVACKYYCVAGAAAMRKIHPEEVISCRWGWLSQSVLLLVFAAS